MGNFLLIFFFCLGITFSNQECGLKDGRYKVLYDKAFSHYPSFEFEVKNDTLIQINSESNSSFIIEKLSENNFRLHSTEKEKDSLTDIQKALISLGKPYYEIINCDKNTIDFVMRINLHIISHSGKFVRID